MGRSYSVIRNIENSFFRTLTVDLSLFKFVRIAPRRSILFTLFSLFSFLFACSCDRTKNTSNQHKTQSQMEDSDSDNFRFKKSFSLSANTRSLINEIEQELASKNIKINLAPPLGRGYE